MLTDLSLPALLEELAAPREVPGAGSALTAKETHRRELFPKLLSQMRSSRTKRKGPGEPGPFKPLAALT